MNPANELLEILRRVISLQFSSSGKAWNGQGVGSVFVSPTNSDTVQFDENGTWETSTGHSFQFKNCYRWSMIDPNLVRLEHLRHGNDQPVYLFDLIPGPDGWQSVQPHT